MSSKRSSEDSGGGELTPEDIRNITRQTTFENVSYLNLFGSNVRDISAISALSGSLQIALLANNRITDLAPVLSCSKLLKLDASSNKISTVPERDRWLGAAKLRVLYLHDNAISGLSVFTELSGALELSVLTMFDTPVSLIKHYRHHAVNTIWSLKCLDQLIVSDEEVIEDARFTGHYSAYNPALRIGSLPYITKTMPESEAKLQCLRTLKLVEGILRRHSPVIIIQRAWRGRLNRQRQSEITELRHWAAVCIQRFWRIKHRIPHPINDAYSPLTGSESPVRQQTSVHEPGEKVPFRVSSARLLASVRTKTSATKIWGAVPFTAGLEGNVFEKRSGKVREALEATDPGYPPYGEGQGEEGLALVAERTSLQRPQQFRDIVTSCREAGRVVREAAKHYREVQRYRPQTVREQKRAPTGNSQRLFMKIQDTMALSCLRAVQQAYKNRAQVEANAARQDRVLLQRHQHKVTLARVDAIKNAARIEALHRRELDDTLIRESIYKQHETERREVVELVRRREDRKREAKERRQYKQFMVDFSCQNASLSKALARHDRRAIRDDNAAASQEQVLLLRDQNTRSQRSVKEYQEFVKLRRQAESQYDKAQMNTILIEERKRRELEVRDRIEYLKSIAENASPPPSVDVKKVSADATCNDILGDYRRTIAAGGDRQTQQHDFLLGTKVGESSSESVIPSADRPPPPPKHLASIRFDLTVPAPDPSISADLSKTSTTDSLPAPRLTRLFLNEFPEFPSTPAPPRHERDITI